VNAIADMGYELVTRQIFDERMSDREHATGIFKDHIADVQSEIAPGRLLMFDLRDVWEPLCAFLGVDTPEPTCWVYVD
jgi:hypothetical protein